EHHRRYSLAVVPVFRNIRTVLAQFASTLRLGSAKRPARQPPRSRGEAACPVGRPLVRVEVGGLLGSQDSLQRNRACPSPSSRPSPSSVSSMSPKPKSSTPVSSASPSNGNTASTMRPLFTCKSRGPGLCYI